MALPLREPCWEHLQKDGGGAGDWYPEKATGHMFVFCAVKAEWLSAIHWKLCQFLKQEITSPTLLLQFFWSQFHSEEVKAKQ